MKPIDQLWERVAADKEDSDTSYFLSLTYLGEFLTKLTTLGLLAAVKEDRNRSKYQQLHRLVRSTGIGEWAQAIDATLTGPTAQFLLPAAYLEQRELLESVSAPAWQFAAVEQLAAALESTNYSQGKLSRKLQGKLWFHWFAILRNKTRGHGALTNVAISTISQPLAASLRLMSDNFSLFSRPWSHLHRNLSGKYRVTNIGGDSDSFDHLRKDAQCTYHNGIYVSFEGQIVPVELLSTNSSVSDFYIANGAFDGTCFEMISYCSGESQTTSAAAYSAPPGVLPESETHGSSSLDVLGNSLTNVPPKPRDYVDRPDIESGLAELLFDDRHPIITLVGQGGAGKTAVTLATIPKVAMLERFDVIIWFSARDIDLLPEGPKPVRPDVLTSDDIARQYSELMGCPERGSKGFNAKAFMNSAMSRDSKLTTLFVFDNFETIDDLTDTFSWLDQYIRNPNKILITTRTRKFRGDFYVEVGGMTEEQSDELIDKTARRFGILNQITSSYRKSLYEESGGHPYVIKMLLGGIQPGQPVRSVRRILASQEDILPALFERTYKALSPSAQRLFLTIANWNSTIPVVGLKCVLLRDVNERMDIDSALLELEHRSLVEIAESDKDQQLFVYMPIAAQAFGKSQLSVSAYRAAVLADTELLHNFGAGGITDLNRGLAPRVARFVRSLGKEIAEGKRTLEDSEGLLEFLARRENSAWINVARLYEEMQPQNWIERATNAIQQYLAASDSKQISSMQDKIIAWKKLAELCHIGKDPTGELNALIGLVRVPNIPTYEVSNAANQFNSILSKESGRIDKDEKAVLASELVSIMSQHFRSASATDLSRLAWLCLHLGRKEDAEKYVNAGLKKESDNIFCQRLAERLVKN